MWASYTEKMKTKQNHWLQGLLMTWREFRNFPLEIVNEAC
jgi:hypothetical protein